MREYGKGPDRGIGYAPARRADERDTERTQSRNHQEVASDKLAEAEKTLETLAADWIPRLHAASQATDGDRRSPREHRAAYDLVVDRIESQFKSAATARVFIDAHAKRHKLDVNGELADFDQKVTDARKQVDEAAKLAAAPVRFQRVPGEDTIAAAIAMPPSAERNTELMILFSELDPVSARTLYRRLASAEPDPEDAIAKAFQSVTTARNDLLGILEGTKKVRIDPRTFRRSQTGAAREADGSIRAGAPDALAESNRHT